MPQNCGELGLTQTFLINETPAYAVLQTEGPELFLRVAISGWRTNLLLFGLCHSYRCGLCNAAGDDKRGL